MQLQQAINAVAVAEDEFQQAQAEVTSTSVALAQAQDARDAAGKRFAGAAQGLNQALDNLAASIDDARVEVVGG